MSNAQNGDGCVVRSAGERAVLKIEIGSLPFLGCPSTASVGVAKRMSLQ